MPGEIINIIAILYSGACRGRECSTLTTRSWLLQSFPKIANTVSKLKCYTFQLKLLCWHNIWWKYFENLPAYLWDMTCKVIRKMFIKNLNFLYTMSFFPKSIYKFLKIFNIFKVVWYLAPPGGCKHNNANLLNGEEFLSDDGCNKCWCQSGDVFCGYDVVRCVKKIVVYFKVVLY